MAAAYAAGQSVSGRLILVRHGQSHANVERRLDTAPPGAELTELGREQARAFAAAHARAHADPPGLLLHSVARRAAQTATEMAGELAMSPTEISGIHEVQAGDLEDRSDDDAIALFNATYQRWHEGELHISMPGGESGADVLERYLPVVTDLRMRYLDDPSFNSDIVMVSHGAAIRLIAAVMAGVETSFVLDHHLANTESVVLVPITEGRWSCVHWGSMSPPFYPEPDVHPVADALKAADPMG